MMTARNKVDEIYFRDYDKIRPYQDANIPMMVDIPYTRLDTYYYEDMGYPIRPDQALFRLNPLGLNIRTNLSLSRSGSFKMNFKEMVDKGYVNATIFILNEALIKWEDITLIYDYNTIYLLVDNYNARYTEEFSWVMSNEMNAARAAHSAVGVTDDCMIIGGTNNNGNVLNTTEKYNGIIWSYNINMNSIREFHTAAGITNDCIVMGGSPSSTVGNTTEIYNGTVWTNSTNMNTIRYSHSSIGVTNDCIVMGGFNNTIINTTEIYNGTVWSNSTNMNKSRMSHSAAGVTNDCIVMGGNNNTTEIYNGTVWTNSTNMNSSRSSHTAAGVTNDCIVMGGINQDEYIFFNTTEIYNDTIWTNSINMNSIRSDHSAAGVTNDCIVMGGINTFSTSDIINTTEKRISRYNPNPAPIPEPEMLWVMSENMNNIRTNHSAAGITNDCIVMGGLNDSSNTIISSTEIFDGIVWTNNIDMNIIREKHRATGVTNDCIVIGGSDNITILNTTEIYNGTTWTNSTNMNTAIQYHSAAGITNDCIVMGGQDKNYSTLNTTEIYNGITWTNSTNMNRSRYSHSAAGVTNDCIVMSSINTETFDGIVWINSNNMNSIRSQHTAAGITNDCIVMGGNYSSSRNTTEIYNGITWNMSENMNSTRYLHSAAGVTNDCIVMGGRNVNTTEKRVKLIEPDPNNWIVVESMNENRAYHSAVGTMDNCMVIGGRRSSTSGDHPNTTEIYNGATWSDGVNINSYRISPSAAGIINDCIVMGGNTDTTEIYNGTTWEYSVELNNTRSSHTAVGITNDCMIIGGSVSGITNTTEVFNGVTWANGISMIDNRAQLSSVGLVNNCMVIGGVGVSSTDTTEIFNGTVWTNGISMNNVREALSSSGSIDNCISIAGFGGYDVVNTTETFNGTVWSNSVNINTARYGHTSSGTTTDCILMGGFNPPEYLNSVEKRAIKIDIRKEFIFINIPNGVVYSSVGYPNNVERLTELFTFDKDGFITTTHSDDNVYFYTNDESLQVKDFISNEGIISKNTNTPYDEYLYEENIFIIKNGLIDNSPTIDITNGLFTVDKGDFNNIVAKVFYNKNITKNIDLINIVKNITQLDELTKAVSDNDTGILNKVPYVTNLYTKFTLTDNFSYEAELENIGSYNPLLFNDVYKDNTDLYIASYTGKELKDNSIDGVARVSRDILEDRSETGIIIFIDGVLFNMISITIEDNTILIPTTSMEDDSLIELYYFTYVENRISTGTLNNDDIITILDPELNNDYLKIFCTEIENTEFNHLDTGSQVFEVPFTKTDTKIIIPEFYENKELFFCNSNQFAYDVYNIENKAVKITLSDKFRFCNNPNQYLVFVNGIRYDREDYKINIYGGDNPFIEQSIYTYIELQAGDKVTIVYVPIEYTEFTLSNIANNDVIYTPDDMTIAIPFTKELYSIFINGKKVMLNHLTNLTNNRMHLSYSRSTINVRGITFVKPIDELTNYIGGNSILSEIITSMIDIAGDYGLTNMLLLTSDTTNTEANYKTDIIANAAIGYEIYYDNYGRDKNVNTDKFLDTVNIPESIIGQDPEGTDIVPVVYGDMEDKLDLSE